MPVFKCSNQKWRVGNSDCIYETKADAEKVWRALLAKGIYKDLKISYDYDGVLSTKKGSEQALKDIELGNIVYIISARSSNEELLAKAKQLGIPSDRVFATGSNKMKVEKIKELKISKHYDDNSDVIKDISGIGVKFN